MTNEMIRARMWEAYKAGVAKSVGLDPDEVTWTDSARKDFDRWLADPEHFPELVGDGGDGELDEYPDLSKTGNAEYPKQQ